MVSTDQSVVLSTWQRLQALGVSIVPAEVGPRDAEAVVRSVIDAHVIAAGHVALLALGAGADLEQHLPGAGFDRFPLFPRFFVKVVVLGVVDGRLVALEAQRVALADALCAVHIVAVAAAHALFVHLALHEGAVNIDLVKDLPVREIISLGQQLRNGIIEEVDIGVGVVAER
jgi:hypothetical protein